MFITSFAAGGTHRSYDLTTSKISSCRCLPWRGSGNSASLCHLFAQLEKTKEISEGDRFEPSWVIFFSDRTKKKETTSNIERHIKFRKDTTHIFQERCIFLLGNWGTCWKSTSALRLHWSRDLQETRDSRRKSDKIVRTCTAVGYLEEEQTHHRRPKHHKSQYSYVCKYVHVETNKKCTSTPSHR